MGRLKMTNTKKEIEEEPILMIEGIDVKELGDIFSGYYLNNSEQVTKIINLYRNQGQKQLLDKFKKIIKEQKKLYKDNKMWQKALEELEIKLKGLKK